MKKLWFLRFIKLFVIFGIPLLGLVYAYQFTNQPRATEEVVPFRPFRMPELSYATAGNQTALSKLELKAPITVVNFWATWCPPCVEEFPAMLELEHQIQGTGVDFVFVSIDEKWSNVDQFVQTYLRGKSPAHLMWDPTRNSAKSWGSVKFPETYIVRRDGWVVEKIIGLQMWTRPIVVKYFADLSQKYKNLGNTANNSFALVPTAFAADDSSLGTAPIVHEQDKKNLDKLRKNIETATQNLQKAEAAQREEERNLKEQRVVHERRQKDQAESEEDLKKIQSKASEVEGVISRTKDSLQTEKGEKKKVEGEISDIRKRIEDAQKRLDRAKDDLTQANKGLNTRVQNIETLEKADESSKDELNSLKSQVDKAKSLSKDRRSATDKASDEIKKREKRLSEIQGEVTKAQASLKDQKDKLDEFEKILRK